MPVDQDLSDKLLEDKDYMKGQAELAMAMAAQLFKLNRAAEARAFTSLAARIDIDVVANVAVAGKQPAKILAANEAVLHSYRGKEFGRPCAVFGSAATTLAPGKADLIRSIFDHHQDRFEKLLTQRPPFAGVYDGGSRVPAARRRDTRVFLIIGRYINSNPKYRESDAFHHFVNSSAKAGLTTCVFEADALICDTKERFPYSDEQIADAHRRLHEALAAFKPDIILLDGNFMPTGRTIDPAWLNAVRQEHGCRIATFVADCYDATANVYGVWASASDAVVIFNQETTYTHLSGHGEKAFLACSFPFDETAFLATEDGKTTDMVIVGHDTRERGVLLAMLRAYEVPIVSRLHSRMADVTPDFDEYADLLRTSRITYNTGRIGDTSSFSVLTGRCFEAILSRTVLLEEVGSSMDDYFVPYVHYVPFANFAQLVMFSQFLCANGDYRRRIAEQAYSWHQKHFASHRFWDALLNRLGVSGPMPA